MIPTRETSTRLLAAAAGRSFVVMTPNDSESCTTQDNPFHCFTQIFEQCVFNESSPEYAESTSTASSGARLEVHSATWGHKDQVQDVTADLQMMVDSDELSIPRTFSLTDKFGDPAVRAPPTIHGTMSTYAPYLPSPISNTVLACFTVSSPACLHPPPPPPPPPTKKPPHTHARARNRPWFTRILRRLRVGPHPEYTSVENVEPQPTERTIEISARREPLLPQFRFGSATREPPTDRVRGYSRRISVAGTRHTRDVLIGPCISW